MVLWRGFCRQNPRRRQKADSFCFVPVNIQPYQANVLSPHLLLALFFDQEPSEELRKKAAGLLTQAWIALAVTSSRVSSERRALREVALPKTVK